MTTQSRTASLLGAAIEAGASRLDHRHRARPSAGAPVFPKLINAVRGAYPSFAEAKAVVPRKDTLGYDSQQHASIYPELRVDSYQGFFMERV